MNRDIKQEKAEMFSLRIISLFSCLKEKGEFIMSKQLLRSGTSIGANIAESVYSESEIDMTHKLSIALKEASETKYWLKLLYKSCYIEESTYISLMSDCDELIKILSSIIKTLKSHR